MTMRKKNPRNLGEAYGGSGVSSTSNSDPGLCVTVIATAEGTAAAINAARWLGQDLNARIALLTLEAAPGLFALDESSASAKSDGGSEHLLVLEPGVSAEGVTVGTCLCGDLGAGLHGLLRRRSLVVIGGRRRWWLSSEEKLERALSRLGHHVIFVEVDR